MNGVTSPAAVPGTFADDQVPVAARFVSTIPAFDREKEIHTETGEVGPATIDGDAAPLPLPRTGATRTHRPVELLTYPIPVLCTHAMWRFPSRSTVMAGDDNAPEATRSGACQDVVRTDV